MTQSGTWIAYSGSGAYTLAAVLLLVAAALAYLGSRLHHPWAAQTPGIGLSILLITMWILSFVTMGIAMRTYVAILFQEYGSFAAPANPIKPITGLSALVTFIAIAIVTRRHGPKVALASATVGTIAAVMIFELPFDLIVMSRVFPRPPAPTAQLTLLYFLPLILWELSSYSLLPLSPITRLSRSTMFALSAMFLVFAAWALFGFSYPSSPIPTGLNSISKILSFVAAITLFLPGKEAEVGWSARA